MHLQAGVGEKHKTFLWNEKNLQYYLLSISCCAATNTKLQSAKYYYTTQISKVPQLLPPAQAGQFIGSPKSAGTPLRSRGAFCAIARLAFALARKVVRPKKNCTNQNLNYL
jgi:hypothetical protein